MLPNVWDTSTWCQNLLKTQRRMPGVSPGVPNWSRHLTRWHDGVIQWKHFPRYWPFVRGIHRCPVSSPHKGQWRGALMFSLICVWTNGWVNNHKAGDLRRYRAHYDVIVMRPRQNGHRFADDIFKFIFLIENCCIMILFPIVQLTICLRWFGHRKGDMPLYESMMAYLIDA